MSGNRMQDAGQEKMRIATYEDLEVYRRSYALALEIHRASLTFPRIEQYALADQMRRASRSICANIAEGFGRQRKSSLEYQRYLTIALSSADEMQVWLSFARDLGYLEMEAANALRGSYGEIARMLSGLAKSWARASSSSS